jgi:hypothetical protein
MKYNSNRDVQRTLYSQQKTTPGLSRTWKHFPHTHFIKYEQQNIELHAKYESDWLCWNYLDTWRHVSDLVYTTM